MRNIKDIDFISRVGNIFTGHEMHYLLSEELRSVDPIFNKEIFEPFTTMFVVGNLINRNTEHFITLDIGANIGYYSVLSSVFCPNSTIYAFEPHPVVFKTLQMNASLYKNINPIQCGISDENKTAILYCDNKNIGGHSFLEDGFGKTFNDGHFDETTMYTVESELKTIDSFNIDFEKVKLVKIDVQGLEEKVANYIFSKVPSETLFIIEKFDGWETKLKEFNTKFAFVVPEDKNIIFIKK